MDFAGAPVSSSFFLESHWPHEVFQATCTVHLVPSLILFLVLTFHYEKQNQHF